MAFEIKNDAGVAIIRAGKPLLAADFPSAVKAVDVEGRILHITGSTEARDRENDIITVNGWDLTHYKKNPVFLWAHDYRSVPIGRAMKVVKRRDPNRLDFEIRFPRLGSMPFADMILDLFDQKIVNASSVGFIPLEWQDLTEEEATGGRPSYMKGRRFKKQELLELSACPVPCNPEALQNAIKGIPGPYGKMAADFTKYLIGEEKKLFAAQPEQEPGEFKGGALDLIDPADVIFEEEPKGKSQVQVPNKFNITLVSPLGLEVLQPEGGEGPDIVLVEGDTSEDNPILAQPEDPPADDPIPEPEPEKALVDKVGQVLNAKNKARLRQILTLAQEILDTAEPPVEEDDKGSEPEPRPLAEEAPEDPAPDDLYRTILESRDLIPLPRKAKGRTYSEEDRRDLAAIGRIMESLKQKLGALQQ